MNEKWVSWDAMFGASVGWTGFKRSPNAACLLSVYMLLMIKNSEPERIDETEIEVREA